MRVSSHVLLPLILATLGTQARGARILAMHSIIGKSHHVFMASVLRTLANAGHEVVFYDPFQHENLPANFTNVVVESFVQTEEQEMMVFKIFTGVNAKEKCWDTNFGFHFVQQFMSSEQIKRLISSNEKFDLIIIEAFTMQEFKVVLGHIFKAPIISLSALPTWSILNSNTGNSLSMSSLPDMCAARTDNMSFFDRFLNAYYILRRLYIYYNEQMPSMERVLRQQFSDMPPLIDMMENVSLVFVNDHLTASYAQPRTPNLIPVAGIHLTPEQPLPQEIQRFMDEATDGVILFCLGTLVPEKLIPTEYYRMLIAVFKPLKQRVLWKTTAIIKDLPPNVLTGEWMPQTDILAHKNCVLFITHGGMNSQIETIHYGVPVIAIPNLVDQPSNAMYFVAKGVGVMLEPNELSRETLSTAINTVLRDPSYARRIKSLSAVFRDRPMSPEQTVVYWTEYVLRHGGAPHLRPAPQPFYQRALLDVVAALLLATVVSVILIYCTIAKITNSLRPPSKNRSKKTSKVE